MCPPQTVMNNSKKIIKIQKNKQSILSQSVSIAVKFGAAAKIGGLTIPSSSAL